jgi:hypothetical protein
MSMGCSARRGTLVLALTGVGLGLGAVLGCGGSGASGDPPGPIRVHVQAADVDFQSTLPAELDLALGSSVTAFQFSISAVSDRGGWSAFASLSEAQVLGGEASVAVTNAAGAVGSAQITGSHPLTAVSGTLAFTFGQGKVSGSVTGATPDLVNGTFDGDLSVGCWVPASGTTSTGSSEPLVLDADFATAACAPFRVLLP